MDAADLKKSFDIIKKSFPKRSSQLKGKWQEQGYYTLTGILYSAYIKEKYDTVLTYAPFTKLRISFMRSHIDYYDQKNKCFVGDFDKDGWGKNNTRVLSLYDIVPKETRIIESELIFSKNTKGYSEKNESRFKEYSDTFKKSKKRFHYFDIYVEVPINKKYDDKEISGHSISAIYDSDTKTIDFFDTNSDTFTLTMKFKSLFEDFFKEIYDKGMKINYSPECLKLGKLFAGYYDNCDFHKEVLFPDFEVGGACLMWTLWFLELRLRNSTFTRKEIIDLVYKKGKEDFYGEEDLCDIIYGYGLFVHNIVNDYDVKVKDKDIVVLRKNKPLINFKNKKVLQQVIMVTSVAMTIFAMGKFIKKIYKKGANL